MPKDITNDLPPVVARCLAACKDHDIDAWMATFAPDALVNDVQREFDGTEAIRAFAAKEIFGDSVTFTPLLALGACPSNARKGRFLKFYCPISWSRRCNPSKAHALVTYSFARAITQTGS